MISKIKYIIILSSLISSLMFLFSACSAKSPTYAEEIEIEVTLKPSSYLDDHLQNHIIYTVSNKGDKTIIELLGEVAFYDHNEKEIGKMPWMFLFSDKEEWEKSTNDNLKEIFRALPANKTMSAGFHYLGFFVGHKELREKIKADWDNITAVPIIKKIIVE
ncbi:MAG: hypothetical protein K8S23_10005 [Candidatus Cloacimonetes bacterium]|nr:hypothetical protein [Candidatus Cloacimonadota bacterium]